MVATWVITDPFRWLGQRLPPWLTLSSSPKTRRRRHRLVTLFVLLHVAAMVVVACPAPNRRLDTRLWRRQSMQAELAAWTSRLQSLGLAMSKDEVREEATKIANQWFELRRTVVATPKAYLRAIGAPQGWYMFTGPDREPQRFELSYTTTDPGDARVHQVFSLGSDVVEPDLVHPDFVDDHRVRRALFQTSWASSDLTFINVCAYFDRHLRNQREHIDDVMCALRARAVEHPSRRGIARPEKEVRRLTTHADGSVHETRNGRRRLLTPKPGTTP